LLPPDAPLGEPERWRNFLPRREWLFGATREAARVRVSPRDAYEALPGALGGANPDPDFDPYEPEEDPPAEAGPSGAAALASDDEEIEYLT